MLHFRHDWKEKNFCCTTSLNNIIIYLLHEIVWKNPFRLYSRCRSSTSFKTVKYNEESKHLLQRDFKCMWYAMHILKTINYFTWFIFIVFKCFKYAIYKTHCFKYAIFSIKIGKFKFKINRFLLQKSLVCLFFLHFFFFFFNNYTIFPRL